MKETRWDWATEEGRAALDLGILAVLVREQELAGEAQWLPRGAIATALGIGDSENALRAVSRGCGRLVGDGRALTRGSHKATVYRASAKGRKMAEQEAAR